MSAGAITKIKASNSLADLAARINAEHEAATASILTAIQRAIAAGKLLLEAKAQLKHGQWLPWLKRNCKFPARTATHYMRLARRDAEIGNLADLLARDAVEQLEEPLDPVMAEGKRLARNVQLATARCLDEIENKMRAQRAFMDDIYAKFSREERIEFHKQLVAKHPDLEKDIRYWRKINDDDIRKAQWRWLCSESRPNQERANRRAL